MRIQLKRNSWFGRFLGHPGNICSFLWEVSWRLLLLIFAVCIVIGFFVLNYYLFTGLFGEDLTGNQVLGIVGGVVDVVIIIIGMIILEENWCSIEPYIDRCLARCWQIDWVEEDEDSASKE